MNQRRKFKELFTEEMKQNDNIILLVGDVGYKIFDHLREEFPSRVINAGASEQLMIGMAAGLAMDGKIPVCYSITPFVLQRPFEFIRNYLNHESIPVKLVGSGRDEDYGVCGESDYFTDTNGFFYLDPKPTTKYVSTEYKNLKMTFDLTDIRNYGENE